MTQDKIIEMAKQAGLHIATDVKWMPIIGLEYAEKFAKLVREDALAQPAPVQEPVAWEQFYPDIGKPQIAFNAEVVGYVAPQRTWIALTDEDMAEIYNQKDWDIHINWDYERAIEAKLKEKNFDKV